MTTETSTQTIQDFLTKYPLTMELQDAPENPSIPDSCDKMINYFVTLGYEGRSMTLYFSTGLGWVETTSGRSAQGVTYDKVNKRFFAGAYGRRYDADDGRIVGRYRIRKPTVADVLDCLASDASGSNESFEEWAANCGYDEDSRTAERIYLTIQKQIRQLRDLLGREAFEELLYQTERQ